MKKTILTIIQVLITVGILYKIFRDPQNADLPHRLITSDKLWIIAGILAYGVVEVLATWRWQILLKVQGINLAFFRVLALLMIGILFNLFMPGGTGGDVIKIFYLLKEIPAGKRAGALLAVLMDRLIGLLGLTLVTGVILLFRYQWLISTEVTRHRTWTALGIMGLSIGGVAFSFLITCLGLAHKLPEKFPFRDKFIDLSIAYNEYARAWRYSISALGLSVGVHIGSFYVFYAAAHAIGQQIGMLNMYGVVPVINTITSLPICVGGAGLREILFKDMLGSLCSVPSSEAMAISLVGFSVLIFWAIVGGVIYLFYRPSEHARISEMETTVHNLEHKIALEE